MALNSVGTPGIMVGRSLPISFSVSISSNFGTRIISMPLAMPKFITVVMAKTWNSGKDAEHAVAARSSAGSARRSPDRH